MTSAPSTHKGPKRILLKIMPLLLIAIGVLVAVYFKRTAPTIERTPPKAYVPRVEITTAVREDIVRVLNVMGTVTPAREIGLRSRVTGEILFVSPNFLPGGHAAEGDILLKIDPTDYQVELEKAQSALDTKKAALLLEQGNQSIAREEMRLISETSNESIEETDLALRKPQLQQAEAAVASAEADLKKATLNLERTIVRAPFNALITERNVNLGARVTTQDVLAVLVGTDEYWIEAAVPLDQLGAVSMGRENGSAARIRSHGNSTEWNGNVIQTTGSLNQKSRMANMIIAVPDPLGLESAKNDIPLMLDDYVTISIEGTIMKNVIELPRTALRDNNTVWLFEKGKLSIRDVGIIWKHGDHVVIDKGMDSGDAVIISTVPTPVDGMRLSIAGSEQGEKPVDDDTQKDANDEDA